MNHSDPYPCPNHKCGSEDLTTIEAESCCWQVICNNCGTRGPRAGSGSIAADLWNELTYKPRMDSD